ncbi:MAG: DUF2194 domain-containing protein [Lachnospiraceae bacterium]|nr:DUF2194 domain-containing protein [Lachnospiraceae bacterium]
MISRRNYFTITVIMIVVFFMFQFTNVVLEGWDGYEENAYAQDRESLAGQESAYQAGRQGTENSSGYSRGRIVYIGSADGILGNVVQDWVNYTKKDFAIYHTVEEYGTAANEVRPQMLVIDTEHVAWEEDSVCGRLEEYTKQGTSLVFCNLPEPSVIKENQKLRALLGIEELRADETTVEGIHLYEGFLLGGERVYRTEDEEEKEKRQDMELTLPWYTLSEETEAYMCGIPEEEMDAREYPPVIWRAPSGDAQVFVVNGEYMNDAAGLGLLSAMAAETKDYDVYPVVNAQNMVIMNCPGLAPENEAEIEERYGQSTTEMFRNIVWPSIVSVYRKNTLGLSCMLAPQYDYEDDVLPVQEELEFYMKRLKEQSAEAGLSGESISYTAIGQKLDEDERFVKELLPDYKFSSFYAGKLTEMELDSVLQEDMLQYVRTVARDYDGGSEVVGYQSEHITSQSILSDGAAYTYRGDFRMRCVETALGYANVGMDIGCAVYPDNDQDDIDRMISDFSWNVRNSYKNFSTFSGTTLSESDQRIRNFLALDYEEKREGNMIYLDFTGTETPAWFILRTDGERIRHIEGGDWQLLEKGVYLIEADRAHVEIRL